MLLYLLGSNALTILPDSIVWMKKKPYRATYNFLETQNIQVVDLEEIREGLIRKVRSKASGSGLDLEQTLVRSDPDVNCSLDGWWQRGIPSICLDLRGSTFREVNANKEFFKQPRHIYLPDFLDRNGNPSRFSRYLTTRSGDPAFISCKLGEAAFIDASLLWRYPIRVESSGRGGERVQGFALSESYIYGALLRPADKFQGF